MYELLRFNNDYKKQLVVNGTVCSIGCQRNTTAITDAAAAIE